VLEQALVDAAGGQKRMPIRPFDALPINLEKLQTWVFEHVIMSSSHQIPRILQSQFSSSSPLLSAFPSRGVSPVQQGS
jgi:hypothetical protein